MPVPNTFANATTSIPLSQLDANFATAITLGNTSIQLGNTVTTLNNMTFANVTVSSGSVTVANVTVTGVGTFAAGSNTAPSITTSGNTNTGFFFPAANTVATTTGGTERIRVDSSGNVGIGTSSPGAKLSVSDGTVTLITSPFAAGSTGYFGTSTNHPLAFVTNNSERMRIDSSGNVGIGTSSPTNKLSVGGSMNASNYYMQDSSAAVAGTYGFANSNGPFIQTWGNSSAQAGALLFATSGSERARITSGGSLLVGASSQPTTFSIYSENTLAQYGMRHPSAAAGRYFFIQSDANNDLYIQSQVLAGVYLTNTGTSWLSVSDERQKEIIEPISNAAEKVSSLRTVIGRYKNDDHEIRRAFLIAQDVQAVLPEAVNVKNDEHGTLGLAYTDVIPLLTAALQEALTKITALEARLTALEAK